MTIRYDLAAGAWFFDSPSGPRRLHDPHGLPSGRQLHLLARLGLISLRVEHGQPPTKLAACLAIERSGFTPRTDAELAAELLEAVADRPGSNWTTVRRLVRGRDARLAAIRDELIRAERLVVERAGNRMRLWPGRAEA